MTTRTRIALILLVVILLVGAAGAWRLRAYIADPLNALPASEQDRLLLGLTRLGPTKNSSALYNFGVHNLYASIWRDHGAQSVSPVMLEIGPGANIAQAVAFTMSGARKYYGLDIYQDPKFYEPQTYQAVAALLKAVSPQLITVKAEEVFTVVDGKVRFNKARIEYLYPHQSYDIPLPDGSVDYLFSNAVFEHIADPEATVKATARVMKRGAISAHQIDMRDHTDFSRPLEFLKLEDKTWKGRFNQETAHLYTNRWRMSQFRESFERNGFELVKVDINHRTAVTEEMRRGLHPDFQKFSLEDLSATSAMVIARKR